MRMKPTVRDHLLAMLHTGSKGNNDGAQQRLNLLPFQITLIFSDLETKKNLRQHKCILAIPRNSPKACLQFKCCHQQYPCHTVWSAVNDFQLFKDIWVNLVTSPCECVMLQLLLLLLFLEHYTVLIRQECEIFLPAYRVLGIQVLLGLKLLREGEVVCVVIIFLLSNRARQRQIQV